MLRNIFPHARFRAPASEQTIRTAEGLLSIQLPEDLRKLYGQCDGFREDRGNAKYLLSLLEDDFIGSLATITRHMWTEYATPDFKSFVFFGMSGGDETWGINWKDPGQVIAYHHHMGDQYETAGCDIVKIWRADYARYDPHS